MGILSPPPKKKLYFGKTFSDKKIPSTLSLNLKLFLTRYNCALSVYVTAVVCVSVHHGCIVAK